MNSKMKSISKIFVNFAELFPDTNIEVRHTRARPMKNPRRVPLLAVLRRSGFCAGLSAVTGVAVNESCQGAGPLPAGGGNVGNGGGEADDDRYAGARGACHTGTRRPRRPADKIRRATPPQFPLRSDSSTEVPLQVKGDRHEGIP